MSKLIERKSRLVVETENVVYDKGRYRKIIVELRPSFMILRLKGTRAEFTHAYTSSLNQAITADKIRKRLEKAKKKGSL